MIIVVFAILIAACVLAPFYGVDTRLPETMRRK
jgi:hypothetical protein